MMDGGNYLDSEKKNNGSDCLMRQKKLPMSFEISTELELIEVQTDLKSCKIDEN